MYGVIVGGGNAAAGYRGRSSIRLNASMREVKEYRGFRLNGVLRSYAYDRASNFMRSVMRRGYALSGTGTGGGLGFRCEWCM